MLRLVHAREVVCWRWDLRFMGEEPARPGVCHVCDLDVAVPLTHDRERPICLYCGIDSGLVEPIDEPIGGF